VTAKLHFDCLLIPYIVPTLLVSPCQCEQVGSYNEYWRVNLMFVYQPL